MKEKLEALMQNEELKSKLAEAKDAAAMSAILAEYGVELTAAQVEEALSQQDELGEADLDNVAGGTGLLLKLNPVYWIFRYIGKNF